MEMQREEQGDQQEDIIKDFVEEDYISDTTQTRASRASGSTGLKRKSDTDDKIVKKTMTGLPPGVQSVIIMNQPRINNFNEAKKTSSPRTPTSQKGSNTVLSTPRAT
eukprot:5876759-Amphidinium_carterae.1